MALDTIALEREVKLVPDLDFELPDLRPTVGRTVPLGEQRLRTAYFDTSDFRLWHQGITLRHRSGEQQGSGTWTIKLPEGVGTAIERTELSWPGARRTIPAGARSVLFGIVGGSKMELVADLVTNRRRLSLRDRTGRSWAELDDDTVTVINGREDGFRFRQLEVELAPGRDGPVDQIVRQLCDAGARPDNSPKLATALEASGKSLDQPAPEINSRARVGDVARASISDGLKRLLDHDYRLRVNLKDPPVSDIHQARVATRRMRSDLKTFRPLLDPVWVTAVRYELRWVGEALGAVRDVDVLMNTLVKDKAPRSVGKQDLRRRLVAQRSAAVQRLADVLTSSRYLELLAGLRMAADVPPFHGDPSPLQLANTALPRLIKPQWRALRRRVRKAGNHPSDTDLHRARIAAKQLRYAAEAATPVIGKAAKKTAKASEHLQTVLGDHHDAVTAAQWLERDAEGSSGSERTQTRKLLVEQYQRQSDLRQTWRSAWSAVKAKKARQWLR